MYANKMNQIRQRLSTESWLETVKITVLSYDSQQDSQEANRPFNVVSCPEPG